MLRPEQSPEPDLQFPDNPMAEIEQVSLNRLRERLSELGITTSAMSLLLAGRGDRRVAVLAIDACLGSNTLNSNESSFGKRIIFNDLEEGVDGDGSVTHGYNAKDYFIDIQSGEIIMSTSYINLKKSVPGKSHQPLVFATSGPCIGRGEAGTVHLAVGSDYEREFNARQPQNNLLSLEQLVKSLDGLTPDDNEWVDDIRRHEIDKT